MFLKENYKIWEIGLMGKIRNSKQHNQTQFPRSGAKTFCPVVVHSWNFKHTLYKTTMNNVFYFYTNIETLIYLTCLHNTFTSESQKVYKQFLRHKQKHHPWSDGKALICRFRTKNGENSDSQLHTKICGICVIVCSNRRDTCTALIMI